ncbi:MAG: nitroreductase [Rhodobacterales bacterium]|nr:MAG: nitroreductase [Rhodobacterales bacterium]
MTEEFDKLAAVLKKRHSCRAFLPDPVERATIEKLLSAAAYVPSWCNAQPWQVIITSGEETDRFRVALYETATTQTAKPDLDWPRQYTGVYQERRKTCGLQLYEAVGIERGDRAASAQQMLENFNLFGAPHMALITSEADLGAYGALDCGGYITAFTLVAQALGIATIPQAAVASFAPFLHQWFDIPENRLVIAAISFGYADKTHPANSFRTERATLDETVVWRG